LATSLAATAPNTSLPGARDLLKHTKPATNPATNSAAAHTASLHDQRAPTTRTARHHRHALPAPRASHPAQRCAGRSARAATSARRLAR